MRLLVVALLLGLSAPAWGAVASLSAQDEARLIYLEKRVGELDAQNRELRAFAEKAAKGEADGVKDILVHIEWAGGVVVTLLLALFALGAWDAGRKARAMAEEKMRSMEGELKAKEQGILDALQKKAEALITEIEAKKAEGDAHVERAKKGADAVEKATAELVNRQSPPVPTPEGERLEVETRNTPPQDLTEEQLASLTMQALAKSRPADVARYAGALAGKLRENPNALILLARSRLEQGLLDEAIDAARRAIEVARIRGDLRAEGVVHCVLGDALWDAGRRSEAKVVFSQYRNIFRALVEKDADNDDWQRELGVAWSRLGDVALEEGNWGEAKAAFGRYRYIFVTLTAKDVGNDDWRRELGAALRQSARAALKGGEVDEAEEWLRQAEAVVDTLRAKDVEKPLYRQDKAWLIGLWGDWHAAKGEADDARRCWGEAVAGFEALEQVKTLNFFGRRVLAEYRTKLAA